MDEDNNQPDQPDQPDQPNQPTGEIIQEDNAYPMCEDCQNKAQALIDEFTKKMYEVNIEVTQIQFRPLKPCGSKESGLEKVKNKLEA